MRAFYGYLSKYVSATNSNSKIHIHSTYVHTNYTKLILRGLKLFCGNTIHNLGVRLLAASVDAAVHVPALLTLPPLDVLLPLS